MRISEIVKTEEDNKAIILHKEGIFWRAYERSAFFFVINVKNYNVLHKYFKNIAQDIVYIGFPDTYFDTIADLCKQTNYTLQNVNDKQIIIKGTTEKEGFEEWKNEIINKGKKAIETEENDILKQVSAFPLASKTPIEAQQFIDNIQKQINGDLR